MSTVKKPSFYNNVEDVLKRSVITEGFEKLAAVPTYRSEKLLKRERAAERFKTKGAKWFNMPATKKTEEINHDLEILQMRSALDPKRFYKRSDIKSTPKYFQVAHFVDSPLDHYSSNRGFKMQHTKSMVDDLMCDVEVKQYTKRKYAEIIKANPKLKRKARKHAKKLKRLKR